MIQLSTNKINLKSSSEELFAFMMELEGMSTILESKKTKHLQVKGEIITFILKWVARFNFSYDLVTDEFIQIKSSKGVEFETVIRFDINKEESGSAVSIHIQTDTAPFVDFTLNKKIQNWVAAMADNLESKFS